MDDLAVEWHGRATVTTHVGEHTIEARYYSEGVVETSVCDSDMELTVRPDCYTQPAIYQERKTT